MSLPVASQSYINNGVAMAGMYYRSQGRTHGASFHRDVVAARPQSPTDPFPFPVLSPDLSVCCSSAGLILCRSLQDTTLFFIINPATEQYKPLRTPEISLLSDCPVALVCYYGADGRYICNVLCAVSRQDFRGHLYTFSTQTDQWCVHLLTRRYGNIIQNSGISIGTMAYFRSEEEVIEIDADDGYKIRNWRLPELCLQPRTFVQLGSIRGQLHSVAVTRTHVLIYRFSHVEGSTWHLSQYGLDDVVTDGWFPLMGRIKPLRFESDVDEFPLLVNGRPVVLEYLPLSLLGRLRAWALLFFGPEPEHPKDCVPFLKRPEVSLV